MWADFWAQKTASPFEEAVSAFFFRWNTEIRSLAQALFYLGVQAVVDALNGKKLDEFIATDATVVTADNAAERRAEVEKRLGQ